MTGTAFNQNTFNAYDYNDRNEVVGGQKYQGVDINDKTNPIPSYDYDYNYDPIGNRETYDDSGTLTSYTTNSLNQYSAISTLTDPVHDDDGNMTLMPSSSGDWTLEWNGENRLVVAESADTKLTFTYDYQGRRVEKKTYFTTDAGVTWTLDTHRKYIYDGWNLIAQLRTQNSELGTDKTYTWGLDLSQSLQGAGGVGGLLSVSDHDGATSTTYYATYDANGNISEYLAPDGTIAAHYEYSPFGQLTATGGTTPEAFAHRFSTKYHDTATELYYYGYRYYSSELGRWPSRDPVRAVPPENLYRFVNNRVLGSIDALGLLTIGAECEYTGEYGISEEAITTTLNPLQWWNPTIIHQTKYRCECEYCCCDYDYQSAVCSDTICLGPFPSDCIEVTFPVSVRRTPPVFKIRTPLR